MYVFDLQTNIAYQFCCDKWLAVEEDDGLIKRTIHSATDEEKRAFIRLFTTNIGRGFMENHLWISVLTKPIYSQFSRVQRITCCFCLLMFSMLSSALIFSFGEEVNPFVLKVGSFEFNYRGVIVGIQSSMISILPTTLLLYIFKNARDLRLKQTKFTSQVSPYEDLRDEINLQSNTKTKGLDRRWRYLGWVLAFAMGSSSFTVCLFYSMMWGDAKSKQFMVAVLTGLFNSTTIVQPLNIIVMSALIAVILKDDSKEDKLILDEYTSIKSNIHVVEKTSKDLPAAYEATKYVRFRFLSFVLFWPVAFALSVAAYMVLLVRGNITAINAPPPWLLMKLREFHLLHSVFYVRLSRCVCIMADFLSSQKPLTVSLQYSLVFVLCSASISCKVENCEAKVQWIYVKIKGG